MLQLHLRGHPADHFNQLREEIGGSVAEIRQRRNVHFGDDDDVDGPEGPRVVICEDTCCFSNDAHLGLSGEHFVAVEIVGGRHDRIMPCRLSQYARDPGQMQQSAPI